MSASFQDVLLKVKESADIVSVIGQYVSLKRAGSKYVGVCPFHNDRSPSMNVNPQMGIYKCFACGAGGDVIKFVQEFEKIGFVEALRQVASKAGVAIPESFGAARGDGEKTAAVLAANQLALQIYGETFAKHDAWKRYAAERGIGPEALKQFQIGCAPDSPERLLRAAEAKNIPRQALEEAGIVGVSAGGRVYDRFGGRLVFPIFNLSGRVIGFGGRIVPGKDGPKYVNTPESPLYHKGRVLYGFHAARQAVDQSGEAVVVEGYMDLVTLWQAGVKNAVAVCGTALTKEHAQMLTRFAKKAVLFFDGDAAGRTAVRRSLEPLLAQGVEVRVPVLPPDEDPDSYARKHPPEALRALFDAADDLPAFLARSAGRPVAELSPEQKDGIVREAMGLLANHPSATVRDEHLAKLRDLLGLRAPAPTAARPPQRPAVPGGRAGAASPGKALPGLFVAESPLAVRPEDVPEWQFLQVLLYHADRVLDTLRALDLDWFHDARVREIVDYLQMLVEEGVVPGPRALAERLPETLGDVVASLEPDDDPDPNRVLRRAAEFRGALELRDLKRRLQTAASLAQATEIQARIKALGRG